MSILIKGMSMPPKDGRAHRAIIKQHDGEFILLVEDAKDFEDRHMDVYPLVEVPEPHGDLIDRDALRKVHAEAEKGRYGGVYLVGDNRFMRRFEDAPAVIRKEGSDDIKCSEKKDS
ncbi:MAG: hypothetical protein IJK23_05655 [Clostridia bacterium]|nr:hypothetical protein [Clostridia bacterium]